jgi:hypothetical protein
MSKTHSLAARGRRALHLMRACWVFGRPAEELRACAAASAKGPTADWPVEALQMEPYRTKGVTRTSASSPVIDQGGFRRCAGFICPESIRAAPCTCGRRSVARFAPPPVSRMACASCAKLAYSLWVSIRLIQPNTGHVAPGDQPLQRVQHLKAVEQRHRSNRD